MSIEDSPRKKNTYLFKSAKMEDSQIRKRFSDLQDLDIKIIEECPWAKEMWAVLHEGLTKTFLNWFHIASKMGKKPEDMKEWVETFIGHFEDNCCELVSEMEFLQCILISNIEKSLAKLEQLCKILQIPMPVFGEGNLGLYQEYEQLKKVIKEYESTVEERKSVLNKLNKKEMSLCQNLGRRPKTISDNPIPSEEQIQDFKDYLENLEQEQYIRMEKFCDTKKELCIIVQELNFKPSTMFENEILSSPDAEFALTDENMLELATFYNTLMKEQHSVKEEISELKNKIDDYWNLLEVPLLEREEFRQKHDGWSYNVLEALRCELNRCENLKKANIKVFVDKLRQELIIIWNKCHCSDSVRNNFSLFHSDCYTEDLLELHEFELKKWNDYYEENQEIICLLNKHTKLWSKMMELEKSAANPNRFNNRGGQLLKEEKERNALSKEIPKIESALLKLSNKFAIHNNNEFQTFGQTVGEYIANLHADRENTKKEKLSARKMQTFQTLTPSKSSQCLFPNSITPKRKLFTPISVSNKKPRTPATVRDKMKVPSIVLSTTKSSKRLSIERKKRIEKIRRLSAMRERSHKADITHSSGYVDFQNEISDRKDCRSTINPFAEDAEDNLLFSKPIADSTRNQLTPKHQLPKKVTPSTSRSPGKNKTNLTAAKSNLKLIF